MTQILVLYYSSYGHIEQMAYAQAEGAQRVAGVQAIVKRVPELVPPEVAKAAGIRLDQAGHLACLDEPAAYARIVTDFLREHAFIPSTSGTETP